MLGVVQRLEIDSAGQTFFQSLQNKGSAAGRGSAGGAFETGYDTGQRWASEAVAAALTAAEDHLENIGRRGTNGRVRLREIRRGLEVSLWP